MLEVQIENIIPVTEARDKFNQIVDAVEGTEELYVLTKNGKPAAIVVGIHHLEKLTGETHTAVFGSETTDAAAPVEQTPVTTAPTETPFPATPIADTTPTPTTDFSAAAPTATTAPTNNFSPTPPAVAPTEQPQAPMTPIAPAPSDSIVFDSMPAQTPIASVPVSIPQDSVSSSTPMDNPLIDSVATASTGQAIAPDAVTPSQTGPSADPFAIPSEPLDLPEDNQVQATPPAGQAQ